jgi:monofunctional glycosyltransferase
LYYLKSLSVATGDIYMSNTLTGVLSQGWESIAHWRKRILTTVALTYVVGTPLYAVACRYVLPPITWAQAESIVSDQKSFRRDYVSLNKISPYLLLAVIAAEDGKFPKHGGFDWDGIKAAMTSHHGGGSTISQQTAKNVFLTLDSNWVRKALEVYPTYLIEKIWGKRRILEVYLNTIEFERGVWGAEAASQKYFHQPASKLTRSQAAWMAVCLPNPKECLSQRRQSGRLSTAHQRVLNEMKYVQSLDEVRELLGVEYLEAIKNSGL